MKKLLVGILALLFSFAVFAGTTDLDRLLLHERYGEDPWLGFGEMNDTSGVFTLEYDDADADAVCLLLDLPAGGTDVPVFLLASVSSDYGYFTNVTVPTFAIEDDAGGSYVKLDWTDSNDARLATGGSDVRLDINSPLLGLGYDLGAELLLAVTDTTGVAAMTQTGSGPTMSWTVPAYTFTNSTSMTTYTPSWVLGYDAGAAMTIAVANTTGNVTITQTGSNTSMAWTAAGGFTFTGDFEVVGSTTLDDLTLSSSLTLQNGEILDNTPDGTVTLTGDDNDGIDFQIIAMADTTTSDAWLTLDADGGGESADTWILKSEADGNDFTITNHETELFNFTTAGNLQIDGSFEVDGAGGIILPSGATITNTAGQLITLTSTQTASTTGIQLTLIGPDDDTASDAVLLLDADAGGDDADSWFIISEANGNDLSFVNHLTERLNLTTAGDLQIDGDFEVTGDKITFGTNGATIENTDSSTLTITETTIQITGIANITGNLAQTGVTALLDGSTSVRGVSAGFVSLEANDIRFGFDASSYMKIVPVQTTGSVAITHVGSGATAVTWTADSFDFIGTMAQDITTFGANAAGVDVTFYGAVTQYKTWWDADADSNGTWYFGADDYGVDVTFYGRTQTESVTWDASADTWYFGASDDEGVDVKFYGGGAGNYVIWDENIDTFVFVDGNIKLDDDAEIYIGTKTGVTTADGDFKITWVSDTRMDITSTAVDGQVAIGDGSVRTDFLIDNVIAGSDFLFDASGDGNKGILHFGADDLGFNVVFYGATQTESVTWDASADTWSFGEDDEGVDFTAYGETAGAALDWDASDNALELDGTANITHEDATNAGALFISQITLTYTQTDSRTVGVIPANADILEVRVITTTAFNGSTDTIDIGWSGATTRYASSLDIKAAGYHVGDEFANLGDIGSSAKTILATHADASNDASAGAALITVLWTMGTPGDGT